ncbi:hypothetical protein GCM10009718_03250 [Isoptericola halotolerans]|uniref:Uncharacterized BrkB/YihY/UPF0761 family membrane protein n=1 Tax=Isoptericola halotolerans TaxID=300560 RepID=A0ABX2A1Y4_9MICO|nr:hypothetical protein [Isoptericola halotolerans]NOV96750.1 uncharacterized BrkB/YihY/UPF0761 family membrane protein [Isoptericola halotolerans]
MDPSRIVLAGGWISLMLVYLLGDVLRIFAGDFRPGEMDGRPVAGWTWTLAAVVMLVPVAMIMLSLLAPAGPLRWTTLVAAVLLAVLNLAGLPYPGLYDNLLIVAGVALNAVVVWQAWAWRPGLAVTPPG